MTASEILALPAGRETDALVAKQIFGFTEGPCPGTLSWDDDVEGQVCSVCAWGCHGGAMFAPYHPMQCWPYSTDIAAAWRVVEHFLTKGKSWWLAPTTDGTTAAIRRDPDRNTEHHAKADSAPLAICRAALLAVVAI